MPSEPRPMTAVVDIDGILAKSTKEEVRSDEAGWAYDKCAPITPGLRLLKFFRAQQVRIVLHTSRWEEDREKTVWWLDRHEVPYDELVMGKPSGDIYIDDMGFPGNDPYRFYEEMGLMLEIMKRRYKRKL